MSLEKIGRKKYKDFVKERIEGETSIWNTIKKEKLPTFASNNKSATVKVNNELLVIREERKLMNRILVASRSRPEIDLSKIFGLYEFSVVPSSIFASDGTLYYGKDKSVIAKQLRDLVPEENDAERSGRRKIIIIDAMAIVNKINIKCLSIENCADFAFAFCQRVQNEGKDFDEVRIVFDRYQLREIQDREGQKELILFTIK